MKEYFAPEINFTQFNDRTFISNNIEDIYFR